MRFDNASKLSTEDMVIRTPRSFSQMTFPGIERFQGEFYEFFKNISQIDIAL